MQSALLSLAFFALGNAQFPPTPKDVKVVKSKFHDGVSISYKEPGICETTPGVKSYSGYVHLPPDSLTEPGEAQGYPINTFFWFFESRNDPKNAPLSIFLNGGPGGSSLTAGLTENGPCFVGSDSNSTYLNPWSWNNNVNMIYLDQPNQVGYSYGKLTNVTVNLALDPEVEFGAKVADFSNGVPAQNNTFLVGTMASQNLSFTANSTNHSAIALWHFAQTWFEEFPHYKPNNDRVSLWTESYGGHYGPAFISHFEHQNELIANGTISGPGTHYIHLDTLGIINGCVDSLIQDKEYAAFAYNNTYGIQAFNKKEYEAIMTEIERPGGIDDMTRHCRKLAAKYDPSNIGDNELVNEVCRNVSGAITEATILPYRGKKEFGWFDITHPLADSQPDPYFLGYLNQHWVQEALGVPVNFSFASGAVAKAFAWEGDMQRDGQLDELAYILERGIKVAFMYGDRDYACSWRGGEEVSLSIPYSHQKDFAKAGYEPIATNPFYSGGQTRQFGNLSFSRVYQAGHMVPYYQPETAYKIFMRSTAWNKDVATGKKDLHDKLKTSGPSSTWHIRNDVLPAPEGRCYTLSPGLETCTDEEKQWLMDNSAIVKDWVVIGREGESEETLFDMPASPAQVPLNLEL